MSHQKTLIYASIFHQIFMFFPPPLPKVIFGGSKRRSRFQSSILEPFWIQGGSQDGPFDRSFPLKRFKKSSTPVGWERLGANLGAKWRRKHSKTIQDSTLTDFGRILDRFGIKFAWFSYEFQHVFVKKNRCMFEQFRIKRCSHFFKNANPRPHKSTNDFSGGLKKRTLSPLSTPLGHHPATFKPQRSPLEHPANDFYWYFASPKRHRKIMKF